MGKYEKRTRSRVATQPKLAGNVKTPPSVEGFFVLNDSRTKGGANEAHGLFQDKIILPQSILTGIEFKALLIVVAGIRKLEHHK